MNKSELIAGLREHLAGKESIANEAAPALKLMRYALLYLEQPVNSSAAEKGSADEMREFMLNKELAEADAAISQLRDTVSDRDGYLYAMLQEIGMVPEIDGEPVDTLNEALQLVPGILDDLQSAVSNLANNDHPALPTSDDKDRFINGVRELLDNLPPNGTADMNLQELWGVFETASRRYASLEEAIIERDQQLEQADNRIMAIRAKLGIPVGAGGSVEQVELARIDQLERQRNAAQDMLLDGRDEPSMADSSLFAPTLPTSWVNDAIDLAHAVRGNLAPENRVLAKAADAIILGAPRGAE